MKRIILLILFSALVSSEFAGTPSGDRRVVLETQGLIAFWEFGEEAGQDRISSTDQDKYALSEVGGPVRRVDGGPFSGYCAELTGKQYFVIPYPQTGELNISGPEAQVSMFAVVRIMDLDQSRTIAGMWSEGKGGGVQPSFSR